MSSSLKVLLSILCCNGGQGKGGQLSYTCRKITHTDRQEYAMKTILSHQPPPEKIQHVDMTNNRNIHADMLSDRAKTRTHSLPHHPYHTPINIQFSSILVGETSFFGNSAGRLPLLLKSKRRVLCVGLLII